MADRYRRDSWWAVVVTFDDDHRPIVQRVPDKAHAEALRDQARAEWPTAHVQINKG